MTPSLAVTSSLGVPYTVAVDMDENVILTGCGSTIQATVSRDGNDTVALALGPTAIGTNENLLCYNSGAGNFVPLKIPLSEGSRIFLNLKAAGTTVLYFDRPA